MIIPGLVSITFRKHTPREVVDLIVQGGLVGVEWGGDVHVPHGNTQVAREVKQMTVGEGLQIAAYGSYYRAGNSAAEGLSFASVLDTARALGAPLIRVWAGRKGSDDADLAYRRQVVDDLHRIAAMAKVAGIGIACEYHGGTLTDTNASAQELLRDLRQNDEMDVKLYWQPPNGKTEAYCLEGLRTLLPEITNLHVFHWQETPAGRIRHPLAEGELRWQHYLNVARAHNRDRHALIEFVKDDDPEQFIRDAATLKAWLE